MDDRPVPPRRTEARTAADDLDDDDLDDDDLDDDDDDPDDDELASLNEADDEDDDTDTDTDTGTPVEVGTAEEPIEALGLLRRVRVRRGLRGLVLVWLLLGVVGAVVAGYVQRGLDAGSEAWQNADAAQGLCVFGALILIVLTLIAFRVAGGRGRMHAAVRAVRPIIGRTPPVTPAAGDTPAATAITPTTTTPKTLSADEQWRQRLIAQATASLPPRPGGTPSTPATAPAVPPGSALATRLRRRGLISAGALAMVVICGGLAVAFAVDLPRVVAAGQGHGGPVVVLGRDASVSRVEADDNGGHSYFLIAGGKEAVIESGRPSTGDRFVVVTATPLGHRSAILVGGHDWVLLMLVVLLCLGVATPFAAWLVWTYRDERRARREAGPSELADDVTVLLGGRVLRLEVGTRVVLTVGLPGRAGAEAGALLARRRRNAAMALGVTAIVVLAGAGTATAAGLGYFTAPPDERDVTLASLAGSDWDPEVFVSYNDRDSDTTYLHYQLDGVAGGRDATVTRSIVVGRRDEHDTTSANIHVADIGHIDPARAVAGAIGNSAQITKYHSDTVTHRIAGLPSGWSGFVEIGPSSLKDVVGPRRSAEAFGAVDGVLLDVSISGLYLDDDGGTHYRDEQTLARLITSLTSRLTESAIGEIERRTARPAHG